MPVVWGWSDPISAHGVVERELPANAGQKGVDVVRPEGNTFVRERVPVARTFAEGWVEADLSRLSGPSHRCMQNTARGKVEIVLRLHE
jgi:hypothetical protein